MIILNCSTGEDQEQNEKGRSWHEVSIFWGRYEILVTGGLSGSTQSPDVVPFLGSNVPLRELVEGSFESEKVLVNVGSEGVKACYQVRNLRNWSKKSSSLKWNCVSESFFNKGFVTTNPLEIKNGPPMVVIMSIILWHIAHKERFKNEIYDEIMTRLKSAKVLKDWPRRESIKSFDTVSKLLKNNGGNKDLAILAEYIDKTKMKISNSLEWLSANEVVRLSAKVYSHAKSVNLKSLNTYRL